MSDELLDGRDLRHRRPGADAPPEGMPLSEAAARAQGETGPPEALPVEEPPPESGLPAPSPEDSQSGLPYVVLEPPPEADDFAPPPPEPAPAEPAPEPEPAPAEPAPEPEPAPAESAPPPPPEPALEPEPAPAESAPPPPPEPAPAEQPLMRLPRIRLDEEPAEAAPPEPADFVPHLHTPTSALPPVTVAPRPADASTAQMAALGYESAEGELIDDLERVLEIGEQLAGPPEPAEAGWQVSRPRIEEPPTQPTTAIYAAIRASRRRLLPLLIAAAVLAAVIFVPAALRRSGGLKPPRLITPTAAGTAPAAGEAASPAAPTPTAGPRYAQGRIAYASSRDGDFDLYVLDMTTGGELAVTRNSTADRYPAWSPDGTRLVYATTHAGGDDDLAVIDARGGEPIPLTAGEAMDHSPTWSPDGTRIVFSREDAAGSRLMVVETACLSPGAPAACELTVRPLTGEGYFLDPAWSPDGAQIALAGSDSPGLPLGLALIAPDGSGALALPGTQTSDFAPAWSPDGTQIAFVSYFAGNDDLWLMAADGSGLAQITTDSAIDAHPAWSPDGRYLVFASDRGDPADFNLYLMPVRCARPGAAPAPACEAEARRLTADSADDLDPAWAP